MSKVKSDLGNMGLTSDGRPSTDAKADYGQPGSAVHPEYESKPVDEIAPGIAVPNKPFELREALMKKPSNLADAKKMAPAYKSSSAYPTVQSVMVRGNEYPIVEEALKDEAGIVEDNDHLEKLGIESPEEFGVKYKGQLDILAEEHDLGDLLAYSLTDYGIIIWGTENVLKLDYNLENPDIKPVYYFE